MYSDRAGLGFTPLAIAGGYQTLQQSGVLSPIGDVFSGVFGDTPDHDPEKLREWGADVAAGAAICAAGETVRNVEGGTYGAGDPGFSEGETIRFDVREVREAIRTAPRGAPGDDPGTVEGLRTAVTLPTPELEPFVRTDDALARVAVGVAHGRIDCGVGWQEEPAVVHLRRLVSDYRARPEPGPIESIFSGPTYSTLPAPVEASIAPGGAMTGAGFLVPLALIGAGLFVATRR